MTNLLKKTYFLFREIKHQVFKSLFGFSCTCGHNPSCSKFFTQTIASEGVFKGGAKGLKRVLSCIS